MPEWEEWLGEVERFEVRWSAQRDDVADWLAAWERWRSEAEPPRETALEYLAAYDELARGWKRLERDAAALAAGPGRSTPPQAAAWRRRLRKRTRAARRERGSLERQRAEQAALAARRGIQLGRVGAAGIMRRLYRRSFRTGIIVTLGVLVVVMAAVFIAYVRSQGFGQVGAGLSWPCSLVAPDSVSSLVGYQVKVEDTTSGGFIECRFLWAEPGGRIAELGYGVTNNGIPAGCRDAPGMPVVAVYCPPPDGSVYFTLGGYQWDSKELLFGPSGTLPDPAAYANEKAVTWLLAADYGPSPHPS
jgi:hypothetical protein